MAGRRSQRHQRIINWRQLISMLLNVNYTAFIIIMCTVIWSNTTLEISGSTQGDVKTISIAVNKLILEVLGIFALYCFSSYPRKPFHTLLYLANSNKSRAHSLLHILFYLLITKNHTCYYEYPYILYLHILTILLFAIYLLIISLTKRVWS